MPNVEYKPSIGYITKSTKFSVLVTPEKLQSYTTQLRDAFTTHPRYKHLKTVVVAIIEDDEGVQRIVYAVNQNFNSPKVEKLAKELGITRIDFNPDEIGRGNVGSPMDAEQVLKSAVDDEGARILVAAPSNNACADCRVFYNEEGIILIEPKNSLEKSRLIEEQGIKVTKKPKAKPVVRTKGGTSQTSTKVADVKDKGFPDPFDDAQKPSTKSDPDLKGKGFPDPFDDAKKPHTTVEADVKAKGFPNPFIDSLKIPDTGKKLLGVAGKTADVLTTDVSDIALSHIRINPKIKLAAGLILTIGLELLFSWLESKKIRKAIQLEIDRNIDEIEGILNRKSVVTDIERFRYGKNMEFGYQLYIGFTFDVPIRCSDGNCSYMIHEIKYKSMIYASTKSYDNYFPDAGSYSSRIEQAIFYQPICKKGHKASQATIDAAYGDIVKFEAQFISKTNHFKPSYFIDFERYCQLFPKSDAGIFFSHYIEYQEDMYMINLVEIGRINPMTLLNPYFGLSFESIIFRVRWHHISKILFIKDFYDYVTKNLSPQQQYYFLEKYDSYFERLDDEYTKCHSSGHRKCGDRRIIKRITADDVRKRNEKDVIKYIMERGTYSSKKDSEPDWVERLTMPKIF